MVALLRYRAGGDRRGRAQAALQAVEQSLAFELAITREVFNPFGYARQYVKDLGGGKRSAFFFPHKNESGYWWQGESARQGVAGGGGAAGVGRPAARAKAELAAYARDQFDWILGLNPFDVCMMQGKGRNNPEYLPGPPERAGRGRQRHHLRLGRRARHHLPARTPGQGSRPSAGAGPNSGSRTAPG